MWGRGGRGRAGGGRGREDGRGEGGDRVGRLRGGAGKLPFSIQTKRALPLLRDDGVFDCGGGEDSMVEVIVVISNSVLEVGVIAEGVGSRKNHITPSYLNL